MAARFALVGPGRLPLLVFVLIAGLPLVGVGIVVFMQPDPGSSPVLALTLAGCAGLFVALGALMYRRRVEFDGDTLEVATSMYRRRIARSDLDPGGARIFDPAEHTEFRPGWRRNGFSLPGYHSGWYSLRKGDKALMAVAGGSRWLYLPTRLGYSLVLDLEKPKALLEALDSPTS